jgi:hypothetical protein
MNTDFSFCPKPSTFNSQPSTNFDRIHPNISNPCRDDERGIDAVGVPAHTRRMAKKNAAKPTAVRSACAGFTGGKIFNFSKFDRWFLVQIKGIVDFEEELASAKN